MRLLGRLSGTIESSFSWEIIAWTDGKVCLSEKRASGKVSVAVEGDENELVAMENLHGGGSAAVIVTVCYSDFYVK